MEEDPEYNEVTLADIVRVLHRRWLVLGSVFLLVVLAGVGVTVFTTPEYESRATLAPLEHGDIIKNWLDSRQAAGLVVDDLGDPLLQEVFADRWDAGAQAWEQGQQPTPEEAATALAARTSVEHRDQRSSDDRYLAITVRLTDPLLARDVADAYVRTLDHLRPHLEDITRQEAFDRYYTGDNQQEAERRAEVTAQQMDYWLPLDSANTPSSPVKPNVQLNIALAVVLGLLLGVFAVFMVEWASNYRAGLRQVEAPPEGANGRSAREEAEARRPPERTERPPRRYS